MDKREKMILALMVVALLGAAIVLFSGPSSQPIDITKEKELSNVKALSDQLTADVNKETLTDTEKYILKRVEADWPSDPFLEKKLTIPSADRAAAGQRPVEFSYTGYLDVGSRRLAIINGMEYLEGEPMETGGYVVRSIDPEKVVLEDMGGRGQLAIPFTGEIFQKMN
jgi:hypothetical protein